MQSRGITEAIKILYSSQKKEKEKKKDRTIEKEYIKLFTTCKRVWPCKKVKVSLPGSNRLN